MKIAGLKMQYIKTNIHGDAAKLINHIDPNPENYMTCYTLLRNRFDNKREILGKLIDNILNIPKMKNENSNQLKSLHDIVHESTMSIKNIGIPIDNWDPLLTHILLHKLDKETVKHYECQLVDIKEPQPLKTFLSYIESRFMAIQSAESKNNYFAFNNNSNNNKPSNNSNYSNGKNTKEDDKNQIPSKCPKCGEFHTLTRCLSFQKMTVYAKKSSYFSNSNSCCTYKKR